MLANDSEKTDNYKHPSSCLVQTKGLPKISKPLAVEMMTLFLVECLFVPILSTSHFNFLKLMFKMSNNMWCSAFQTKPRPHH